MTSPSLAHSKRCGSHGQSIPVHEVRENEDGTISVLAPSGVELLRGAPPAGRGLGGFRKAFHQKSPVVLRCLKNNTRFFLRAVYLDTFEAVAEGDSVAVSITWRDGGAWNKSYPLSDMPPACGMKRLLLRDMLEARGI